MNPRGEPHPKAEYVLGVDVARMGKDSTVFIVLERFRDTKEVFVVFVGESQKKEIPDTVGRILFLDNKFNFNRIYIDSTSLGSGVFDLVKQELGEWKVKGIDFSAKSKVEMYYNLKHMMERGILKYPKVYNEVTKKLFYQLVDLKVTYTTRTGELKKYESIHHSERGHDDFPDALALACLYFKPSEIQEYDPIIL